jgi:protein required for attachment to host cells
VNLNEEQGMKRVAIKRETWVLVCDGAKSLLFENVGDARAIQLKLIEASTESHAPTRELGSDRPGRAYDAMDGSRSAMETTDWHAAEEEAFLGRTAERLNSLVAAGRVDRLVVVAPPKALGILRGRFSTALRKVLAGEISRDLVKIPTAEVERMLAAHGELPEA